MRKLFLLIALFLMGILCSTNAQNYTKEQKTNVAERIKKYDDMISLSEQQCSAMQPLMLQQTILIEKLNNLSVEDKQWQVVQKKLVAIGGKIDSVLTDEQREQRQLIINRMFINNITGKDITKENSVQVENQDSVSDVFNNDTIQ